MKDVLFFFLSKQADGGGGGGEEQKQRDERKKVNFNEIRERHTNKRRRCVWVNNEMIPGRSFGFLFPYFLMGSSSKET